MSTRSVRLDFSGGTWTRRSYPDIQPGLGNWGRLGIGALPLLQRFRVLQLCHRHRARSFASVVGKVNDSVSSTPKVQFSSLKQGASESPVSIQSAFEKGAQKLVQLGKRLSSLLLYSRGSKPEGIVKCPANYIPLSPISFLERSASVYSDTVSLIYGSVKYTWKETYERCLRLASSLTEMGISRGDVVAVLSPNTAAVYELHFGVPMAGGVLCTLNIRYNGTMVAMLLENSGAKVFFFDYQFLHIAHEALDLLSQKRVKPPVLVLVSESENSSPTITNTSSVDVIEYESLLMAGQADFEIRWPKDELEPISLNYTSGTTSNPKGVVYNHRGAYLNALATVLLHEISAMPVYLWTVPMFHCNGWCLIWGLAAQGGTNICVRKVIPKEIFECIVSHKVTHMGGAPTVLNMIVNSPASDQKPLPAKVKVLTGGSSPPLPVLLQMEDLGFDLIPIYGLTETYGPGTFCPRKPEWNGLSAEERMRVKSRQGLHHVGLAEVDVRDPVTMVSVPPDGKTMGEVMFRGNTVMSGYWNEPKATAEAFKGGWFRTGDLGVKDLDGYIKLKDRSKDIIISGGENVSSMEVESVLSTHPAVLESAVVRRPDEHWGETVCAFVKLKDGHDATAEEIIKFCRSRLPHFMAPRTVCFDDLPKTSTGKTQKFILREKAKAMGSLTKA